MHLDLKVCYKRADNTLGSFGYVLRRLLFMARNKVIATKPPAEDDLLDDDFDGDDSEVSLDAATSISQPDRLVTRRRLEDYFEEKRLREQLGDDFF
ncbi:MAG: hypothetical protein R6X06_06025 [Gammaproteobacteria bacterium]